MGSILQVDRPSVAHELLAGPRQRAQLLHRPLGDEARPDEPVGEQVREIFLLTFGLAWMTSAALAVLASPALLALDHR